MTTRANLNALLAACQAMGVPRISYLESGPGVDRPTLALGGCSRDEACELAAELRAPQPTAHGRYRWFETKLVEPDLVVWIFSEELEQAFDRASVAVTGVPAAQLTARLNDNLRRHPDRQFDDSDIEPPTELDFGPEDDQRTSPVPQQTMAEVVSDGGERPRITESGPVRVKGE